MMESWPRKLPGLIRHAVRFFLPADCATCGVPLTTDPVPLFCTTCWETIAPLRLARCSQCDRPLPSPIALTYSPTHRCHHCVVRPPAYAKAWTLYPYLPPLQDAICLFKYRGKVSLAKPLGQLLINALPAALDADLVIPVPLHPTRLREREFNQSLLLADQVATHLHLPLSFTNLVRSVPSEPQSTLSRKERMKNLRRAFIIRRPELVAQKRILLIDDVFTTGTTVNECAKVLRKAGADAIFVLTLARTIESNVVPDRILAQRANGLLEVLKG
ncbi:ComF family protein [Nitrospira lenta]|uniref:Putative Phosphoribosyltransferase n=1 Tax=Nitrospira lenta TaxID=1436998 RepID=A0A330L380_9BACT|nr:ComF family protein [Nitrospira lenta]SPP63312.1 putative Phosphoribosyltransferase [Nitrospira lenta]